MFSLHYLQVSLLRQHRRGSGVTSPMPQDDMTRIYDDEKLKKSERYISIILLSIIRNLLCSSQHNPKLLQRHYAVKGRRERKLTFGQRQKWLGVQFGSTCGRIRQTVWSVINRSLLFFGGGNMIETPLGEARFVVYDSTKERVLVQWANGWYQWFDANDCFVKGVE